MDHENSEMTLPPPTEFKDCPPTRAPPPSPVVGAKRFGNQIENEVDLSGAVEALWREIKQCEPAPFDTELISDAPEQPSPPKEIKDKFFAKIYRALKVRFAKVLMIYKKSLPKRRQKGVAGFRWLRLLVEE